MINPAPPTRVLLSGHALGAAVKRLRVSILLIIFLLPVLAQEKHLSIYGPQAFYQVSVTDHAGVEYVGLLDVLEPLGKIESRVEGKKWKLRFTPAGTAIDAEFEAGKRTGKIRNSQFDLGSEFFLQNDRGYVPTSALPNLLPRFVERTVDLHVVGRRLFLSGAAMKYSLELRHNPTRLVITFPAPVSPDIAPTGNKVRLTFTRNPVISSGAESTSYSEAPFVSAAFSENNGNAVLEISGSAPLQAVNSDAGKVITISGAQQAVQAVPPPTPPPTKPETPLPPPNIPAATPTPVRPAGSRRANLVVIDAGHGGDERGAQLTEKLNEKEVTLALARRIQREFENHGFTVLLLRSGDSTMTTDQRASAANASRAGFYIGLHAATLGTGVRVYTSLLSPAPATDRRKFLPWDSAQAPFLDDSRAAAAAITSECASRKIPVRNVPAPLRPLNNIAGVAIAVEIAPEGDTVESINDAKYQQNVAAAVAAGIAAARGKLESQ